MFPITDFLEKERDLLQIEDPDDIISLFAHILGLPRDEDDLESASKLLFHILPKVYGSDNFYFKFYDQIIKFGKNNSITVVNINNVGFDIEIRDPFFVKLLFFNSLKFNKCLISSDGSLDSFLLMVLLEATKTIACLEPLSFHLLKLIEMILKKGIILTPYITQLLIKRMNIIAHSPITGFKQIIHNIGRIVLRSFAAQLVNVGKVPYKGFDIGDIVSQYKPWELKFAHDECMQLVLALFSNNTNSRNGSVYYQAIVDLYSFEDFLPCIWPYFAEYLKEFDEGEFYQSLLKYWIPITVSRYREEFYRFLADKSVHLKLRAYILYESKKKGCYVKCDFDDDVSNLLKITTSSFVALRTVCTFSTKHIFPTSFEIESVKYFLIHYARSEFSDHVLESLKLFLSQLFLLDHINLNIRKEDLDTHSNFLHFVFRLCLHRINANNCWDIASQLLKIVWDISTGSSSDLITSYKIDKDNVYDTGANLYYQYLQECGFWQETFQSGTLTELITSSFGHLRYRPRFIELVQERYIHTINQFVNFAQLCDGISDKICIRSSTKIRSYTCLIVAYKKHNLMCYQRDVTQLMASFDANLGSTGVEKMFKCVLILDVLSTLANHDDIDLVNVVKKSFLFFNHIFDNNLHSTLTAKEIKVFEMFVTNAAECFMKSKKYWFKVDKRQMLMHILKIVQTSNMKRPITTCVSVLHNFASFMEEDDNDKEIKTKLLQETLNSLHFKEEGGKMRRNPETRLVIRALCVSDRSSKKLLLISSLRFMLEILENPSSSDFALASTLHCLEVLMSDSCIFQFTLPFIEEVVKNCIQLFKRTSWIIRNADLQLVKCLVDRIYGVALKENLRPKSIQCLFVLFPALVPYFYNILSSPVLDDRALITLLFFSESYVINYLHPDNIPNDVYDKFRNALLRIAIRNSGTIAHLAIKGYTALALEENISEILKSVLTNVERHFVSMPPNMFINVIELLRQLYNKGRTSLISADDLVKDLALCFRRFNHFYFNMVSLKVSKLNDILNRTVDILRTGTEYETRIWLNNNVPYLILELDPRSLPNVLDLIFAFEISEHLQIHILSVLTEKLEASVHPSLLQIAYVLILKVAQLRNYSKFLVEAYAKAILYFCEIVQSFCVSEETIIAIRPYFHTDELYKVFVYVMVLSHYNNRSKEDLIHCTEWIRMYVQAVGDEEILKDLAGTLIHLYKCCSSKDKYQVVKLAIYLLLNDSTSFEMCKFISILKRSLNCSVLNAFVDVLRFSSLTRTLGDEKLALKCLSEIYSYLETIPDELQESDTYYLSEDTFSLPKQYVKTIILASLSSDWKNSGDL